MQKHIELTRQRLQNFARELAGRFYLRRAPLILQAFAAPGRIAYAEALRGDYRPLQVGEKFGPLWSTHWVRVGYAIPAEWKGQEVHLLWDSCSEACVWQAGAPQQGLTGSHNGWQAGPLRTEFCLARPAQGGEQGELYIEVACNGLFGIGGEERAARTGELRQAELALFDRRAWDVYWDLQVIADMAQELPADTPRGGQALFTANQMVNLMRLDDPATWPAARQAAAHFFAARNGGGQHNLSAVGHAHIDTAWLWPLAETRRKCARTFASAVRNMDEYPAFRFVASQAQQYAWMKADYPALYARMQEKARLGQFIPAGGAWVEPDCNIPSGESLVRQFLYGQRFFQAEFGRRCREFWNPDVFGYSGALPQIMKQAGIDHFLTQKLSWNQFNKPASHTFLWEGIDGSRLLTHFPPADTYNSLANVHEVVFNVRNFKDHERAKESYLLFGYGDGGGGPTPAMLEQLQRMPDVDGLPRVQMRSPQEFFARCAADIQDPLVVVGELYFELHRGTYTSQARNKRFNRQAELLLREAEIFASLALAVGGSAYPAADLEALWKRALTNQFHDIIPGSSIHEVYQDSSQDYTDLLAQGGELRRAALQALLPTAGGERMAVFNSLGWARRSVAALPGSQSLGIVAAPALGWAVQSASSASETVSASEQEGCFVLDNSQLTAVLDRQGGLLSLVHKASGRECIEPGQAGNRFVLFEDLPNNWDAWDVDVFHLEKPLARPGAAAARLEQAGPLCAAVRFEYALTPDSRLSQVVSLDALAGRLEFDCTVEWRTQHQFLKVEFPLNVRTQAATYEIQFGHLQRPTHFNNSYDMARFEVPAHRWADLSEPDFGAALLNDCKYGYAAHGNTLRLSLLRGPTNPDPQADQGEHRFRYALYPHSGGPQTGGVVQEAYDFNVPLLVLPSDGPEQAQSWFSLDGPALVIDTLKKAEDSQDLILRLYESRGTRGAARLSSPLPIAGAARANLLEDELAPLAWQDGGLELAYRPFEIITLKLSLDSRGLSKQNAVG